MMLKTFLGGSLFVLLGPATALANDTGASPYAGSENREIKALSTDEIIGLTWAAELNHYLRPTRECAAKRCESRWSLKPSCWASN